MMRRDAALKYRDAVTIPSWFDGYRADYNASKTSRFRSQKSGINAMGSGADWHYRHEHGFMALIEMGLEFDRNNPLVGQGITRLCHNILLDGFRYAPKTGDEAIDDDLSARWKDWAADPDQCDIAGEHNFHELEKLALRGHYVAGDVIGAGLETGHLETWEAYRVRTPTWSKRKSRIIHGVEIDQWRRRQRYYVTKDDTGFYDSVKVSGMAAHDVRDEDGNRQIFHLYNPLRVTQTRGVTVFAPMADLVGMHDDTLLATLAALQGASCITFIRNRPFDDGDGEPEQLGAETDEVQSDGSTRTIQELAPGLQITTEPGEKIEAFSPNIPNPQFLPFQTAILQLIAVNLGMPIHLFLLDATKTNFSGFRGALDQARIGFEEFQRWFPARWHRPVVRWKIRQWMEADRALRAAHGRSGVDVFQHAWNPPVWKYLEPLKDRKADKLAADEFQTSPRRLQWSRGREWQEIVDESVADKGLLIERALEEAGRLNGLYPQAKVPVTWRDVLNPVSAKASSAGGAEGKNKNTGDGYGSPDNKLQLA